MSKIHSYTLQNNLRIFVYQDPYAQKVALQMWYGVGSKDERSGERGLAHLLEHMIFKGTNRLSESDINLITHRLSGYTNAFTSHDFTGYLFDLPKQHWSVALDLFADCMVNCTFKPDLLNSELKAVIQELKMYKDDYMSSLAEEMTTLIFESHPYHYPIIGYKQDLCDVTQAKLLAFYKKHYVPNNAALIVVGDVDPEEVYAKAQQFLGNIPASQGYEKQTYLVSNDIKSTQITIKRDIEQSMLLLAWQIPGASAGAYFYFDVLRWIIAQGNGSRLYKKLVEELQLATSIDSFIENLSDQALFFVRIYPKDEDSIQAILQVITDEMSILQKESCNAEELQRAIHQVRMSYLSLFENPTELAYAIGQSWFATGDVDYVLNYLDHSKHDIMKALNEFLPLFSTTRMHQGSLVAMGEGDEQAWVAIQEQQDGWDEKILSRKERITAVEPGSYVDAIQALEPSPIEMPPYETMVTQAGLTLLLSCNKRVNKIDVMLDMRFKAAYDPTELSGLAYFTYMMLQEGCKKYPGQSFMQAIESHGMMLEISTGTITLSALKEDLEKGLELLQAMFQEPLFDSLAVEKVRARIMSELNEFWDTPSDFVSHLADERIYKQHPFSRYYLGTHQSVERISADDIRSFWQQYGSPDGAYLAIVGALEQPALLAAFDRTLAHWHGPRVAELVYPPLASPEAESVQYLINRDQTVLCIAGLSVDRMHKDYDALLIFDQILTGGMLGSMSSRLFQLREQTGLFYTIGGSVVLDAGIEPGMVMIKTIVSLDRLQEAEKMIKDVLSVVPETVEEQEIVEAKNAIINTLADGLSTNMKIAQMLIFLARYELDASYITKRADALRIITSDDIQAAAQRILNPDHLVVIKVGRDDT